MGNLKALSIFHRSSKTAGLLIGALGLLTLKTANAGYVVTGPIKAEDCYSFGIQICKTLTVTEYRSEGRRYEIAKYFDKVSSYNEARNLCSINTKSRDWGVVSLALNAAFQPEFWGYDKEGKFVKIDADRIYFNCLKK